MDLLLFTHVHCHFIVITIIKLLNHHQRSSETKVSYFYPSEVYSYTYEDK